LCSRSWLLKTIKEWTK